MRFTQLWTLVLYLWFTRSLVHVLARYARSNVPHAATHGNAQGNWWDFFKPELASEYPSVDGPLTLHSYIGGLEQSYESFVQKEGKRIAKTTASAGAKTNGHAEKSEKVTLKDFDYVAFHGPYGKLVQKGTARLVSFWCEDYDALRKTAASRHRKRQYMLTWYLFPLPLSNFQPCAISLSFARSLIVLQMYLDYLSDPSSPEFANVDPSIQSLPRSKSLLDKSCEKTFVGLSSSIYKERVWPSTQCMRRLGNMYTASVYGGLASIIDSVEPENLLGKRIALFSFGSGLAASWFTLRVRGDTKKIRETVDLKKRLAEMEVRPCKEFIEALQVC